MDLEIPKSIPSSTSLGVEVLLYTRAGCCLCDEAKKLLRELQKRAQFEIREIDIDQDPELRQRYNEEVPVVFIRGKKAFKYRVDPKQFLRRLERESAP